MAEPKENVLMEKIVSLCKRRGFIFQSSEIYGGINGFWDYGPLGAELKRNVKESWWRHIVHNRDDVAGLEATIIMHPKIWEASGHVATFADLMVECKVTKKRFRADQIEPQSGTLIKFTGAVPKAFVEKLRDTVRTHDSASEYVGPPPASPEVIETAVAKQLGFDWENELRRKSQKGKKSDLDVHLINRMMKSNDMLVPDLLGAPPASDVSVSAEQYAKRREKILTLLTNLLTNTARNKTMKTNFTVLLAPGKPPESARKVAALFYEQRGIKDPFLLGETVVGQVKDAVSHNPDNGAELTEPQPFNLMFKTRVGPVDNPKSKEGVAYLRPETAQAIFAQFKNVLDSSRQKMPFGIGQVGKAFRNEVTPRNYTFRSREFEQMELEYFIRPDEATEVLHGSVATAPAEGHPGEPQPNWGWQAWHRYWVEERVKFYEGIGLSRETLGFHVQTPAELAHYARACTDILFKFPFSKRDENGELQGEELEGIAARGDFDLSQHEKFSGKPMSVFEDEVRAAWAKLAEEKKTEMLDDFVEAKTRVFIEKKNMPPADAAEAARQEAQVFFDRLSKGQYIPHVIEPSAGVDRLILALIANAYFEETTTDEKGKTETRVVMKFHPRIAPVKVGVFPLLKNRPELVKKAAEVRDLLRPHMTVFYDEAGSIGRRYARQDEAGTPFGVTIDFDTLGEKGDELKDTVTLRDRDTQKQERVKISELVSKLVPLIR